MKCVWVLVLLTGLFPGLCLSVLAQDDQYVRIYSLIQEGDSLNSSARPGLALAKYIEAQTALQTFQKVYPDWNTKVVNFRLNYLASSIAELSARQPAPAPPAPVATTRTNSPVSNSGSDQDRTELENQVRLLQGQLQQAQANNLMLEAKLKEAFSAQPATVDPRELAKAQERIRSIEKENALLKVSLGEQQDRLPPQTDTNVIAQLKQDLAEANRKLAEQTDKAAAAAIAAAALQKKLDVPVSSPASVDASGLASTQKALENANRRLAEQTDLATRLAQEKDTLQVRLRTLESNNDAMNALRAENEILKKQLTDLKPRGNSVISGNPSHDLAEAQAQIAALQSDKEILHLQTIALQERVKQLMTPAVTATAFPATVSATDSARVKQLESEKAELQKKLEAAQKQLYGRKGKNAAAQIEDLTGQLEVLRARLGVYETQAAPYSPEELALMKPSDATLAAANPRVGQKSVRELPAGTATLVAEAQRDFSTRQFDKAEQKYLQVVQQDDKNTYTLANLATIQLQLNHLDEAEKHIHQALTQAPDDAYSLLVLGEIDIRRDKYDAALDALSRAAKLDTQNPEIQNYLGLTLSQKGLRTAAETAFRKAIQLDPDYASAHNNLAVFYVTQKPPWTELARWHYKKALAAGFSRNPDLEKLLNLNQPAETTP